MAYMEAEGLTRYFLRRKRWEGPRLRFGNGKR